MSTREKISVGECYHVLNRGVDKRSIIKGECDSRRFVESLEFFNTKKPVGHLRDIPEYKTRGSTAEIHEPLVEIICYALNPNHFHLLLKEVSDGGISELMKRLSGGYTWYFNNKHKRSGALFQGRFKSVHIESNEQLLHVSAYINLNNQAHKIRGGSAKIIRSSYGEYLGISDKSICSKEIILGQFKTLKEYKDFAELSLKEIIKAKENKEGIEMLICKYFF